MFGGFSADLFLEGENGGNPPFGGQLEALYTNS